MKPNTGVTGFGFSSAGQRSGHQQRNIRSVRRAHSVVVGTNVGGENKTK